MKQRQQAGGIDLGFRPQHTEDVGANPGQPAGRLQPGPQPLGDCDQQQVADIFAEAIVQFGEVRNIQQGHNRFDSLPGDLVEISDEPQAVGQLGQWIVIGGIVEALDQLDVAKAGGDVGGEHLHQRAIQRGEFMAGIQKNGRFLMGRSLQIQHGVISSKYMLVF